MSLAAGALFDALCEQGVQAFSGVPCSQLDGLVRRAGRDDRYVAAASEGEAVAVAAGAWLGGQLGAVLMQNSGLGNAVNPLTSLADTFGLPMLLLVSHRGHDGHDAPQHGLMGRITLPLLELLGVPARVLPADDEAAAREAVAAAVTSALELSRPAALVVTPGTFAQETSAAAPDLVDEPRRARGSAEPGSRGAPATSQRSPATGSAAPRTPPTRLDALRALEGALRDDDLVVTTTGMTSRELAHVRDRAGTFGMVGSMGCAAGLGLGLARARPARRVVVVDGDGALLMKLGSLASVAHHAPRNLLHVLLDNGCYESTGGQACASASVDFAGLARAAGYAEARAASDADGLGAAVSGFTPGGGPAFVSLAIAAGRAGVGRVPRGPREVRDAFRAEAAR